MTSHGGALVHVLVAMIAVIAAARVLGAVFRRIDQPPVVGEMVAGVLLGPSLLGRFAPRVSEFLFPSAVVPHLQVIAQIGVLLFMFLVGLELDTKLLQKRSGVTVAISLGSILVPLALGASSAFVVYPRLAPPHVPFGTFALFLAISLSVTAFPVLARILADLGLSRSDLGVLVLTCAALGDVAAWCLLALVVSVARSNAGELVRTLGLTAVYVVSMLWVVRPVVARLVARQELVKGVTPETTALAFVGLLASALATEYAGIHALFGAFLFGAIIPHGSHLAQRLVDSLSTLVVTLFLPVFFAVTGLRTQIGLVEGAEHWLLCAGLVLVACLGKFGGSAVAGRVSGLGWRDAASVGVLMNTRGLMELIVLGVGLDLGVISPALFAMLVLMALVTTIATTPLLVRLQRDGRLASAGQRALG